MKTKNMIKCFKDGPKAEAKNYSSPQCKYKQIYLHIGQ